MENLLTTVGTIAGIGGLSIGVFLLPFRETIRKKIFPTLTKQQGYKLIVLISILIWCLSVGGIIAWTINPDNSKKTAKRIYNVKIMSHPTSVNFEADLHPDSLRVELHCGENIQWLQTLSYPVRKSFSWSPNNCGDVSLYISVGNIILKKSFTGRLGFPEFLRVFSDGNRIYRPNEFNIEQAKFLKEQKIEFLDVHFHFEGDTKEIMQFISN